MVPNWYELPGSFTIEAWFRPSRLFLGSAVEGAIISCLVTDRLYNSATSRSYLPSSLF